MLRAAVLSRWLVPRTPPPPTSLKQIFVKLLLSSPTVSQKLLLVIQDYETNHLKPHLKAELVTSGCKAGARLNPARVHQFYMSIAPPRDSVKSFSLS